MERGHGGRRGRGLQARHRRQHHPDARRARRGGGLRLLAQRGARRDRRATAATGATSGRSTPTTTRTWTSSRSSPIFNLYNQRVADPHLARPAPAREVRLRRRGPARARARLDGLRRRRRSPAATARRSVLSPGAHLHSYAEVEDSILMQGVDIGRRAVVRRAILDKNVRVGAGRADRRRPRGRPRALHRVRRRRRGDPQGRRRWRPECASRCSPASTRRTSTAAPACTSSTSRASWRRWRTSTCTRGARPARRSRRSSPRARGTRSPASAPHLAALRAMSIDLTMAAGAEGAEVVHSHTWYANFGGHLAKLVYDIPHVATVHSLEPLRPWKAEQLGGGYALSSFCERTGAGERRRGRSPSRAACARTCSAAYPAIDPDRVEVIYNGIDTDGVRARPGDRRARAPRRRPRPAARSCSSGASPARRGSSTCCEAARAFDPPRSSCSAPARRTRPRSAPRSRARVERAAARSAAA